MNVEVLISCMNASPLEIIERTGINTNVIVVNQCDESEGKNVVFENTIQATIINTQERGLSRSRNMAIKNSHADICLLCDDDEVLDKDYSCKIIKAFDENIDADLIAFMLHYEGKKYFKHKKRIGYLNSLKISSVQIAFRRKSILDNNLWFNEKLGAGTGNGAGEENKFLFDCLNAGLQIYFIPIYIGEILKSSESSWFEGFNNRYFENRGWVNKILFGVFFACLYDVFFACFKYPIYKKENSFWNSFFYQLRGTFSNR